MKKPFLELFTLISITFLGACGGGGGGANNNVNVDSSSDPSYTAGVFQDDSLFKNRCRTPRTGSDINGNPFPDIAGSFLYENHWLRSWSNDTYLWYDEIPDLNPANYNDPIDYFSLLKTNALTPSGAAKDQFHFTRDTAEYQQATQSGLSISYGIDWELTSSTVPRDLFIRYIEPGSPADQPAVNLRRGIRILEIDGVTVETANSQTEIDILNAGLFPSAAGETHSFLIQDVGSNNLRTVTLSAAEVIQNPVPVFDIYNTNNGNVGYILFNTFSSFIAEDRLVNVISQFENTNVEDLIIDLRYNGGGFLYISSQLGFMVAGTDLTEGKTFSSLRFNDKHPRINPVTGAVIEPTPFYNATSGNSEQYSAGVALPELNLNRVFILTTDGTCSASESLINGLRGVDVEVILIGTTTCGKPYGFYATDNCGTSYFTIQFDGINDKGEGSYADGFTPMNDPQGFGVLQSGCYVDDDITSVLGDTSDPLISAALDYRATGNCPSITKSLSQAQQQSLEGLGTEQQFYRQMLLLNDPYKNDN